MGAGDGAREPDDSRTGVRLGAGIRVSARGLQVPSVGEEGMACLMTLCCCRGPAA